MGKKIYGFQQFIKEGKGSNKLLNIILDKIGKFGVSNLSYDERIYLNQYENDMVDHNLEKWLLSNDDLTFSMSGHKLLYNEFEDNEDLFHNYDKLKRVIVYILGKKPFTNNSDWGGSYVWSLDSNGDYIGRFLVLGDDDLVILDRELDDDQYKDEVVTNIRNVRAFHNALSI